MVLKRYIAAMLAAILLFGLVSAVAAGTASDPVASLSYIKNTFIPQVEKMAGDAGDVLISEKLDEAEQKMYDALDSRDIEIDISGIEKGVQYVMYMGLLDSGFYVYADSMTQVKLQKDERLVVTPGSSFMITSGSARLEGDAAAEIVNSAAGARTLTNNPAATRAMYISASDDIVTVRASSEVTVSVQGGYQVVPVYRAVYYDIAFELRDLGLFKGSNLGFELEREATRLEALIMFLRIIGEEDEALSYTGTHPFTDVPYWAGDAANKYVAYAYNKGYTNGISSSKFGTYNTVVAEQYMTFVLRALGYKDGVDFSWESALDKAVELGIFSRAEQEMILRRGFYRDLVAYVSYYSLTAMKKGSSTTLIQSLVNVGSVDQQQANEALSAITRIRH